MHIDIHTGTHTYILINMAKFVSTVMAALKIYLRVIITLRNIYIYIYIYILII